MQKSTTGLPGTAASLLLSLGISSSISAVAVVL
jgi:hypothetical protein